MNGHSPSKNNRLPSRLVLAALLASLPGSSAWAGVLERPISTPVSVSAPITPSIGGPSAFSNLSRTTVVLFPPAEVTPLTPLLEPIPAFAPSVSATATPAIANAALTEKNPERASAEEDFSRTSFLFDAAAPRSPGRWTERAKSVVPAVLVAAGTGAVGWALHHFGLTHADVAGPLVMLAGAVSPLGTGGGNEPPTEREKADFYRELAEKHAPGRLLTPSDLAASGWKRFQWNAAKSARAADALADDNQLARLSQGHFLRVDILQRHAEKIGDPKIAEAVELSKNALDLLNHPTSGRLAQSALALADLERALRVLPREIHPEFGAELASLYRNLNMELARTLASDYFAVQQSVKEEGDKVVRYARDLVENLDGVYYDGDHPHGALSETAAAGLLEVAQKRLVDPTPHGPVIATALLRLKEFILHAYVPAPPLPPPVSHFSTGASEFSSERLDAALEALKPVTPPGGVFPPDAPLAIGRALGIDRPRALVVLNALAGRGDIGVRAENALRFTFGARARTDLASGVEEEADVAAWQAVLGLNKQDPREHMRGLLRAAYALELYAHAEKTAKRPIPQAREAKILRDNLAIEFVGDLLRQHRDDVERQFPADSQFRARRTAEVDAVLAWVNSATFAQGHTPALPRETRSKILVILYSMNPETTASREFVDAYFEAYDLIEKYDPSRLDARADKFLPSPSEAIDAAAARLGPRVFQGVRPGGEVKRARVEEQARELGIDPTLADLAVRRLASDGWILVRDNGALIRLSVPGKLAHRSPSDDAFQAALEKTRSAVHLLNSPYALDHLRAILGLNDAEKQRAAAARAGADTGSLFEELRILRANAVLESAGDALRALERFDAARLDAKNASLTEDERAQLTRRRERTRETLRDLESAYYSSDRAYSLPVATAERMKKLLDLRAFRALIPSGTPELNTDIVRSRRAMLEFLNANAEPDRSVVARGGAATEPAPGAFRPLDANDFPTLHEFGTDLTHWAAEGKLDPLIGRQAELHQLVKTLIRRKKNNPLLAGDAGVGKTAIVEGLAQRIVNGEIPELAGRSVVKIDLADVVRSTTLRGQFEEHLRKIIAEAVQSKGRVILFIDEIHTIIGTGSSEGSLDAANILKPALTDGSLSLIGATTLKELRRIERDPALLRRFNPIKLAPPTPEQAVAIVEGVKHVYEAKHGVTIPSETVKASVDLAARHIPDRALPDSALDLIDDAAGEIQLSASAARRAGAREVVTTVTSADIAREIESRTGIPVAKLTGGQKDFLRRLPGELKGRVIGQDHAVEAVARAVQRVRLGYRDPQRATDAFVFLGPTGVGKTELVKALALLLFDSEDNMTRIDMSEFMEKHSVSRLIGAPPGYVGFDQGGLLTEAVRRKPYQVILLDEIEKAHPDVFNLLLQVLEDGRLTDSVGTTVDFRHVLIIMTSNVGAQTPGERRHPIGFQPTEDAAGERDAHFLKAFKEQFRPELVNRVGEENVVVFNLLTKKEQFAAILDLRLAALNRQQSDKRIAVALSAEAREAALTAALSTARSYGARPLKQLVDRAINQALADAELDGRIADGDSVLITWDHIRGYRADKAPDSPR